MFNISNSSYSTVWGNDLGKSELQDQQEVDSHLVYSDGNRQMANTTHPLPGCHSGLQQTVRQYNRTADWRAWTELGKLEQTNCHMCGKVARLFKQRGDWLCSPLFIEAFIWGRNRLCEGQGAQSSTGAGFVSQSRLHGTALHSGLKETVKRLLLFSFAYMPFLDHHFYKNCYKSFFTAMETSIVITCPPIGKCHCHSNTFGGLASLWLWVCWCGLVGSAVAYHQIISVKNILRGLVTFIKQLPAYVICMKSCLRRSLHSCVQTSINSHYLQLPAVAPLQRKVMHIGA